MKQTKGKFEIGFILTMVSTWLLFDSVVVSAGGHGLISGVMHNQFHNTGFRTASMALIFIPFVLGMISLVYTSGKWWSWVLTWSGIGIIVIEMLSKIRFVMNMKSSYLMLVFIMFSVGTGLMLKSSVGKENE